MQSSFLTHKQQRGRWKRLSEKYLKETECSALFLWAQMVLTHSSTLIQ